MKQSSAKPTQTYRPRVTDAILDFKLKSHGAVVIEGAKWCGKTTSAKQFAKSVMSFGDGEDQNTQLATIDTNASLLGETPRLFDEWQEVPPLWDAIRHEVDRRNTVGQFILTGSTIPFPKDPDNRQKIHHSGIGRFSYLRMRPMSLFESGDSTGKVSLKNLFTAPKEITTSSSTTLEEIAFLACRGGWPFSISLSGDYALAQAKSYYDALVNSDISRVDEVDRDPRLTASILRSLARNQGSQIATEEIARDANINPSTARTYLSSLSKIFATEDAESWNPNLRSKTAIRTSSTRYFVDPSLATSALHVGPDGLINDLNTFGLIFETLVIRDLRIYSAPLGGTISHYRDKRGLECDAVVTLEDGRYGLVEVKLGQTDEIIKKASDTLTTLRDSIDTQKMPAPSFIMLITANGKYAYRRPEDNLYVVPISTLSP